MKDGRGTSVETKSVARASLNPWARRLGDYLDLLKARVISLVVFTGLVGLIVAPGGLHPLRAALALAIGSPWDCWRRPTHFGLSANPFEPGAPRRFEGPCLPLI